jgi:hypothetical protein
VPSPGFDSSTTKIYLKIIQKKHLKTNLKIKKKWSCQNTRKVSMTDMEACAENNHRKQ